jgi:hypothetical protein
LLAKEVFTRVINLKGQFQIYGCTPSSLELTYPLFLDVVRQTTAIYNKYRPADRKSTIRFTGFQYNFSPETAPDRVRSCIPVLVSAWLPYWIQDKWRYENEKYQSVWTYTKPTLNGQLTGTFQIHGIYNHRLRFQPADLSLTTTPPKTGLEVICESNETLNEFTSRIAYFINKTFPTVFNATVSSLTPGGFTDQLTITNLVVGNTPNGTNGNTGWHTAPIIVPGTPTTAEVTTFKVELVTTQSKYIIISSPTINYYIWFNVDNAGADPATEQYYLDYLTPDEPWFYELAAAKFMQTLGQARDNFNLRELEIGHSGARMISDGVAMEERVMKSLIDNRKLGLAWG